jgi:hypothetical protein
MLAASKGASRVEAAATRVAAVLVAPQPTPEAMLDVVALAPFAARRAMLAV